MVCCWGASKQTPSLISRKAPEFYSSERIDARVVDETTGNPVDGAVVVAVWRQVEVFIERWDGIYRLYETRTDSDGRFTIPRWGPRPLRSDACLDKRDPEIWVLKSGYRFGYFDNAGQQRPFVPLDVRGSAQREKVSIRFIKLPPNKMPHTGRGEYARTADGYCIWNGKILTLRRASSARELAASLAAANPLDPYLPRNPNLLPQFWSEWQKAHESLPVEWQPVVSHPVSLLDVSITNR